MRMALDQARVAGDAGEVPVGCVFVDLVKQVVVARGTNATNRSRNGTRHCELVAADEILERHGRHAFSSCTLFVTLEPCLMCAGALQHLGVSDVVFGAANYRFGGCGGVYSVHTMRTPATTGPGSDSVFRPALEGFSCRGGVLGDEAIELLREFYAAGNPSAPDSKRHRPLQGAEEPSREAKPSAGAAKALPPAESLPAAESLPPAEAPPPAAA